MRPLIVAEPMLRAPRPEIVLLSKRGALAGAGGGDTEAPATGPVGATMARVTFVPAAGKAKSAASAGTLTSTRSSWKWPSRGLPLGPVDHASGIHTPANCS